MLESLKSSIQKGDPPILKWGTKCPSRLFSGIILVLVVASLFSHSAEAISEDGYAQKIAIVVSPFFGAASVPCEFKGAEGIQIRCKILLNPNAMASVIVVNGYTENMDKYAEVAYDFFQLGYSVFLIDHRGQGYSGRLLSEPQKATIDEFDHFVADLHSFIEKIVTKNASGPKFLVAHSFGGAVSARYLEEYPNEFQAAALFAPMFEINLNGWPEWLAKFMLAFYSWIGRENEYVKPPRDPDTISFEENIVTHSRLRHDAARKVLASEPNLKIFGQTNRWVQKAIQGSRQVLQNAEKAITPLLILQAGKDQLVLASGLETYCTKAKNCRIQLFPDAKHEILQESDSIRDEAFRATIKFFGTIQR
jgi:lysophospholipase